MNKSTKGALAAAAAGVLLLGGAGSLAYWSSDGVILGTDIDSGQLALSGADCGTGWTLDGGTAFVSQKIVPGDTLTQVCTFTVDAVGEHLAADFDVVNASFAAGSSSALTGELDATAEFEVNDVEVSGSDVALVNNDVVKATITVDFDGPGATNASNAVGGLSATLDDITITATQTHDAS